MRTLVAVFARAPVPGACKRRLEPALGAAGCARLQGLMVEHTVKQARASGAGAVALWCTPDVSHPLFVDLAVDPQVSLWQQSGDDLGERMASALEQGLRTADAVLLVGCDCPQQDAARMADGLQALRRGAAVVLRPARDGGYVAVGMARAVVDIFGGVAWGQSSVLGETRSRLRALDTRWTELAALDDVDTPADLALLPHAWRRALDAAAK